MTDFARRYSAAVELILGEIPSPVDDFKLRIDEQRCGAPVPLALHEFYRVARPAYQRLCKAWRDRMLVREPSFHLRGVKVRPPGLDEDLLAPGDCRVEEGMFIFQSERHADCHAIEARSLWQDDPPVHWRLPDGVRLGRESDAPSELVEALRPYQGMTWLQISSSLSDYLERSLYVLAAHRGLEYHGQGTVPPEVEAEIAERFPALVGDPAGHLYGRDGQVLLVFPGTGFVMAGARTLRLWEDLAEQPPLAGWLRPVL